MCLHNNSQQLKHFLKNSDEYIVAYKIFKIVNDKHFHVLMSPYQDTAYLPGLNQAKMNLSEIKCKNIFNSEKKPKHDDEVNEGLHVYTTPINEVSYLFKNERLVPVIIHKDTIFGINNEVSELVTEQLYIRTSDYYSALNKKKYNQNWWTKNTINPKLILKGYTI